MFDDIPIIEKTEGGYYEIYKSVKGEIINKKFVKENMSDFFPTENYEVPKGQSNYMRFQEGINRFRVLSSAIVGYEYFTQDNKPVRSKDAPETIPSDIKKDGKVKHFWAFAVWNYQVSKNEKGEHVGAVQVLEITQNTIMKPMMALINNSKWGNPKKYDIAITKTGEGLDTEYTTQAEPPIGEPEQEIKDAYGKININLEALYDGEDPFKN
jgi:hypothetical protein